jgi:molybdenum cofactor cytidylyltransferase
MIAAVVPAAGRSLRMGRPKLTLPVGGVPLISRVVTALRGGGAETVVVVAPPLDEPAAVQLADEARRAGAEVVVPDSAPPDMRASVELGLACLGQGRLPVMILLAPGDSPGLSPALVARLIGQARDHPESIVVPAVHGRRGHPVALPWSLATEIRQLPIGLGVNALLVANASRVFELEVDDPGAVADLDTPDDYDRWAGAAQH